MSTDIPILTFNKIANAWFDSYTTSWLGYPDGVNQNNYLEFAESDLVDGLTPRHLINSVSNAKRALHMEVESLSDAYGYIILGKKFNSFPLRLEFLAAAGFFQKPRLLAKLNKLRNIVEHDYYNPTVDEAENFIDIVGLFIDAMKRHRQRYPDDIEIHDGSDDTGNYFAARLTCNFKVGELRLTILPKGKRYSADEQLFKLIRLAENRDEYIRWLSFIVGNNT